VPIKVIHHTYISCLLQLLKSKVSFLNPKIATRIATMFRGIVLVKYANAVKLLWLNYILK